MTDRSDAAATPAHATTQGQSPERRPYATPRIEALGTWSALTLVTSVPVGPGGMIFGGPTDA